VNCVAVRHGLAEHAVGGLEARDAVAVEGHLQWCAACRKEAGDLREAASTLAFAVAPVEPPEGLQDRITQSVRVAASRRGPGSRRSRVAVVGLVAATLALSGLGWGAVMAGRAARFQDQADQALRQEKDALRRFADVIGTTEFSNPENQVFLGTLTSIGAGTGGGTAMTFVSPSISDIAFIVVTGLPPGERERLPYTVKLLATGRRPLTVGRISRLDADGGATVSSQFDRDLGPYDQVVVRDGQGHVVLSGSVTTNSAAVDSPPRP
jgi:predicted anti-sigma-YlaC factor YlaD